MKSKILRPQKQFMKIAINEALMAKKQGDYAVGAVIIKDGEIVAQAGNRVKIDQDPTHHAEIVVIRTASNRLGTRHLEKCILYTTHEPCPMCASAAIWARMAGIVYGAEINDMANY